MNNYWKLFFLTLALIFHFEISGSEYIPVFFSDEYIITIDGDNRDWPAVFPFVIESDSHSVDGFKKRVNGFGGHISCFFSSDNLYIYASIQDIDPGHNPFTGFDIHRGDCLEIYLGFRKEVNRGYYLPSDHHLGIGVDKKKITVVSWRYDKREALDSWEITTTAGEARYRLEGRIPLSLFFQEKVNPGQELMINFQIDDFSPTGPVKMNFSSDSFGWIFPASWQKVRLFPENSLFNQLFIAAPVKIYSGDTSRIYFQSRGKPFRGRVEVNGKQFFPDSKGGITFKAPDSGQVIITARDGDAEAFCRLTVESRIDRSFAGYFERFLSSILHPLLPLLIFFSMVLLYFSRRKEYLKSREKD